jgi:sigma-B regulation protein RsbU (phosphoserine phosphatase)
MKGNLSKRLIVWIGVPAALLFALVVWSASKRSLQRVIEQTETSSRVTARYHAARLESVLHQATKIPQMIALEMEIRAATDEASLESYLREVVARNPEIYGSCIAFEPRSFTGEKEFYAPYFYRKEDGSTEFVQLGNPEYNYFKWDWYRLPREAGRALWSEPYYDEGGGNAIMTTYSVPFRRAGQFWGIATIDLAMTQLVAETERIAAAHSQYAFIVSKQGRFLAFPDKSRIMKATIQEANPELGLRMVSGEDGFFETSEPLQGAMPTWRLCR